METTQIQIGRHRGRPRKLKSYGNLKFCEVEKLFAPPSRGRKRRTLYEIDGYGAFKCTQCNETLRLSEFQLLNAQKFYFSSVCNSCCNKGNKEHWKIQDPIAKRAWGIRRHASRDSLPVDPNIEMTLRKMWTQYRDGTARCAYTGIPLNLKGDHLRDDHYWTVDRVIPEKGYVTGNMVLCANLINRMKQNMTLETYLDTCLQVITWFVQKGLTAHMQKLQTP